MARSKQTRRRKHKGGTQAGTVRPRGRSRSTRPKSRAEARATADQRRQERLNRPPSWGTALQRGGIAAAALFVLLALVFKTNVAAALPLAILAAVLYIPGFYFTDRVLYRARLRRRERERARQQQAAD
jgi:Flp pilus assembly protein TadB